jgi:hypothetical protein
MDSNEGNIISFFGGIDIAIGRMIVNNPQQAEEMVNKVIEYHDIKSYGSWRNNFVIATTRIRPLMLIYKADKTN